MVFCDYEFLQHFAFTSILRLRKSFKKIPFKFYYDLWEFSVGLVLKKNCPLLIWCYDGLLEQAGQIKTNILEIKKIQNYYD